MIFAIAYCCVIGLFCSYVAYVTYAVSRSSRTTTKKQVKKNSAAYKAALQEQSDAINQLCCKSFRDYGWHEWVKWPGLSAYDEHCAVCGREDYFHPASIVIVEDEHLDLLQALGGRVGVHETV